MNTGTSDAVILMIVETPLPISWTKCRKKLGPLYKTHILTGLSAHFLKHSVVPGPSNYQVLPGEYLSYPNSVFLFLKQEYLYANLSMKKKR